MLCVPVKHFLFSFFFCIQFHDCLYDSTETVSAVLQLIHLVKSAGEAALYAVCPSEAPAQCSENS